MAIVGGIAGREETDLGRNPALEHEVRQVIDRDRQGVQSLASLILENFSDAGIRSGEAIRNSPSRRVFVKTLRCGIRPKLGVWVIDGNWDGAGTLLNNHLRIDAVGPSRGGEKSDCEQQKSWSKVFQGNPRAYA
jgi:hypothetical protein